MKSIGNIDLSEIPTCYPETEDICDAWSTFHEIFNGLSTQKCLKACTVEEYKGRVDFEDFRPEESSLFQLIFRYSPPYKVLVTQEYLIYDFIGLVGSVGGTMGIFIGFSFYDVFSRITAFLTKP